MKVLEEVQKEELSLLDDTKGHLGIRHFSEEDFAVMIL
jgi:hypothetical protein